MLTLQLTEEKCCIISLLYAIMDLLKKYYCDELLINPSLNI